MSVNSITIPSTCSQALTHFLTISSFSRRTRESYAEDLAPLLAQIGRQPLSALTAETTQFFLHRQERLARATYTRRLAALSSFLHLVQEQGWLTDDLLAGVKRSPVAARDSRLLDPLDIESLLHHYRSTGSRVLRVTRGWWTALSRSLVDGHQLVRPIHPDSWQRSTSA